MQILNFTEPLVKPALQDKSKCFTIRKAWNWLDEGQNKKACWKEQQECRHKVGALEQIMWMQRGKNGLCSNCIRSDINGINDNCYWGRPSPCKFSKVFGVGKILQTQKIWIEANKAGIDLTIRDSVGDPLEIITETGTFFRRDVPSISRQDGFKNPVDFKNFFLNKYPILLKERMPFWKIGWEWQNEDL